MSSNRAKMAKISWEGDSREVLREWPKPIREDFGVALGEMQESGPAALPVRPMPSIAAGVFELKDADERKLVSAGLPGAGGGHDLCPALLYEEHGEDGDARSGDGRTALEGSAGTVARGEEK